MLKAVAHHTDERWVLLYISRWLTAPMQMPDGTLVGREKGPPIARRFDVTWSEGDAAERVLDEWSNGGHRGLIGSPLFVDGEGWFCLGSTSTTPAASGSPRAAALDSLLERASVS